MSTENFTVTGNQLTLLVCRCNNTLAEFDAWAVNPAVTGPYAAGLSPKLTAGVGERAYLLPRGAGIAFHQSGVDFLARSFGRPLPDLRKPGGATNQFGQPEPLPDAELDAKGATLYSALAAKILGRLAVSPRPAPTVLSCSAGTPTVTLPAGFTYRRCDEPANLGGSKNGYTWCPEGGGCLSLTRQPFFFGTSEGDAIEINGNRGNIVSRNDSTSIGWSDGSITWFLSFPGSLLSREALITFARSVRPELVASTPIPSVAAAPTSTSGRCATVPTLTLPSGFEFKSCTEQGPFVSFIWDGPSGRGRFTLSSLPITSQFASPAGGTAVEINGHGGTIASQGGFADVWSLVWTDGRANFSIGASGMSRDAVLAAARSVR